MENKIVAKIKGSTWSSISFVVKDADQLGKLFKLFEGMKVVESSGFTLPDGYKSVSYEDGAVSLTVESAVEIFSESDMAKLKKEETQHAEFLSIEAKAQEPEKAEDTPVE